MPIAFVIGASRGLGLGLCEAYLQRGWEVIGTVRAGGTGLHKHAGPRLTILPLDITDVDQIALLRERLDDLLDGRPLDLLFVNAGVIDDPSLTVDAVAAEAFSRVMLTNALAPMQAIAAFEDLVAPAGTIAVMSSELGSVAGNESGGYEVYRASKAALNMLMRSYAARRRTSQRCLLAMSPGWVRTDMGGPQATLSVAESAAGMVDVIAAQAGRRGLRSIDYRGQTVPW